jgi:hypothetical protein
MATVERINFTPAEGHTVDAPPVGFTQRIDTTHPYRVVALAAAEDGYALTRDSTTTVHVRDALSYDAAGRIADVVIRGRFRATSNLGSRGIAILSNDNDNLTGYALLMSSGSVTLNKFINNTQAGYSGTSPGSTGGFVANTWYLFELERTGSTVRYRIWEDGTAQPSWKSGTDSPGLDAGWVCVATSQTGGTGRNYWDWVEVEYEGTPDVQPPDTPTLTANPGTGFALLTGSAYIHSSDKAHAATEWDLGGTVVQTGPVVLYQEIDLDPATLYAGRRVRYQDEDGEWSAWSAPVSYTTLDVPRPNTPTVAVEDVGPEWVQLRSGAYSHVDLSVEHTAARFRLTTPGGVLIHESDVLEVDEDGTWSLYIYANEDEPLTAATNYRGGVQHLGSDGVWSLWGEVAFATLAEPVDPPPPPEDEPLQGPLLVREDYYQPRWAKILTPSASGASMRKYGLLDVFMPALAVSTSNCGISTVDYVPFVAGTQRDHVSKDRPGTVVVLEGPGWYTPTVQPIYSTSSYSPCSGRYPDAYAASPFFVPPTLFAPLIESPDGAAPLTAASVTVRLAALSPAPLTATLDLQYSRDGLAWTDVAQDEAFGEVVTIAQLPPELAFDARSGSVEVAWDIDSLPPGVYQLRARMVAPVDEDVERPLVAGSAIVEGVEYTRWRYSVPLYVHVPGLLHAPTDTLVGYVEGGDNSNVEWDADPIRSRLLAQNLITGPQWQRWLDAGEPLDVEVTAQIQGRAWDPSTWAYWQFNALRRSGVGAVLSGDAGGQFGIDAAVHYGGAHPIPDYSSLVSNRASSWKRDLLYGRSSARLRINRRSVGGTSYVDAVGVGNLHEGLPLGAPVQREPWYAVRMRVTTLAIHPNDRRDVRVRAQVTGPGIEVAGPDVWHIDTTLTNVELPCGGAGLLSSMSSAINPDVQTHFRGLMVLPLDYGPCGPAEPPSALDIKTNVYCEQLTVWGINHEGIQPPSLLEAELVISWVSTGIELYSTVGTTTEWKFPAGQFPTDVMLEAKVRWQDTYTELWSDWSSLQFVIDSMPRIGQLTLVSPLGDVELDDLTEIQLVWKLEGGTTDEVTYSGWATHNGTRVSLFSGITATQYNLDLTRFVTGSIFVQIDAYGPCDTRTILYFVLEREAAEELCWPIEEVRIGPLNTIKDLATAHLETVDKLNELIRCFNISMETIWERLWPDVKPRK